MDLSIKKYSTQRVLRSAALVLLLFGISKIIQQVNGLIFSIILLFIFAALFGPIALGIAKKQYERFIFFRKGGFLKSFSGIFFRTVKAGILAIIYTLVLAVTVLEFSNLAWLIIFINLLLVEWLHCNVGRFAQREFKYPLSTLYRIAWSKWGLSAILAFILVTFDILGLETFTLPKDVPSHLLQEAISTIELLDAFGKYLADSMLDAKEFLWTLAGASIYFIKAFLGLYSLLSVLDWVYIPLKEFGKVVLPIKDFDSKNVPAKNYLSATFGGAVCLTMIAWLPVTNHLEQFLSNRLITEKVIPIKDKIVASVEVVDGDFYEPGTIEKLEVLEEILNVSYNDTEYRKRLKKEVVISFDQLEENIDLFLDQYYSMPAEYIRLAKMVTGDIDDYLTTQLNTALMTDDPFKNIRLLNEAEQFAREQFDRNQEEIRNKVKILLDDQRVTLLYKQQPHIVDERTTSIFDIDISSVQFSLNDTTEERWIGSAASGVIVGIVAKRIVRKLTVKGSIKSMSKALLKVVGKKAATVAAGTGIGGGVGSIVPGAGTASGAFIGLGAALTVDYFAVKLDETMNRDDLKNEILSVINEQEKEIFERI